MTRAHSRLGASSAERWMTCPGSVLMSDGIPDRPNEYAMEGTAAHTLAEACLNSGTDTSTWLGEEVAVGDRTFPVNADMAEAVQVYLDAVRGDLTSETRLEVETTFNLHQIYPGLFGTNDACVYDPDTKVLRVYDYKHGYRVVNVVRNPQLMYYALGAALAHTHMPLREVELVIVQPRCPHPDGPVRRWSTAPADLIDWSADLFAAAKRTEPLDAPIVYGEHCEYCPAGHSCPERREKSLAVVGMDGDKPAPPEPSDLSPEDLGDLLTRIRLVDSWMKRVRDYAYSRAIDGDAPVGWKIVEKRPTRRWIDNEKAVDQLHELGLEDGDIFEQKLLSPAKADKLLGKQKKAISDFVVKESSGTTLAQESDRRPAVIPALLDFKP